MFDTFSERQLRSFCKLAGIEWSDSKRTRTSRIKKYLQEYKYAPRYLRGLTEDEKYVKMFEIRYHALREKRTRIPSYRPSVLDSSKKSGKISKYTDRWNSLHKNCKSIACKSRVSGVSPKLLQKVYDKGMNAWRGGAHRPGASQQAWGVSRVNSFLLCGKTWEFPDHLIAKEALKSPKVRSFWKSCDKSRLGIKTRSR
jgi:hypothetical protein